MFFKLFFQLFNSKLKVILASILIFVITLVSIFGLLIANKSGKFLNTQDLYSALDLTQKEKEGIRLTQDFANFEPNDKTQIINSDKCNLQIKLPKQMANEDKNLELRQDKIIPNATDNSYNQIRPVIGGEEITKEKILKNGDILETYTFLPNQEFRVICADKQTVLDIFKNEELELLK